MINVGDVVLLNVPGKIETFRIPDYVMTVTSVSDNKLTGVNSRGQECTIGCDKVTVIAPYTSIIEEFTKKGIELVARAEQG